MTDTAASTTAARTTARRRRGLGARRGLAGAAVLAVVLSGVGAACGSSSDDSSTAGTSAGASGTVPASESPVTSAAGGSSSGGSSSGGSSNGGSSGGGTSTSKPVINTFTTPENIDCHNGNLQNFTASWSTSGATRVTISIDGPGVYEEYGPSGEASLPFNCSSSHTFLLTAYSADGGTATKQVTLQPRNVQGQGSDDDTEDSQP